MLMHVGPFRITGGKSEEDLVEIAPSLKPKYLFPSDVPSSAIDGQNAKLN